MTEQQLIEIPRWMRDAHKEHKVIAARRGGEWIVSLEGMNKYWVAEDSAPIRPPAVVTVNGLEPPIVRQWIEHYRLIGYAQTVVCAIEGAKPFLTPTEYTDLLARYPFEPPEGYFQDEDEPVPDSPEQKIIRASYTAKRERIGSPSAPVAVHIVDYIETEQVPDGLTLHRHLGGNPVSRLAAFHRGRWFRIAAIRAMAKHAPDYKLLEKDTYDPKQGEWSFQEWTHKNEINLYIGGKSVIRGYSTNVVHGDIEEMVEARDETTAYVEQQVRQFLARLRPASERELQTIYQRVTSLRELASNVRPYQKSRDEYVKLRAEIAKLVKLLEGAMGGQE